MKPARIAALLVSAMAAGCTWLAEEETQDSAPAAMREPLSPEQASQIYVEKGVRYMDDGLYDIALKDMQKAVELDDDNSEAHNALGVLYQRIDNPSQADSHFRKAISLKTDNYAARNNYGRFLCATGQAEDAFEQFRQVYGTKLYGQPWIPLTNAGICARSIGQKVEAERYLRQALETNPRFPPALLEMARVSHETAQPLAARGFLQRYFAATSPGPEALLLGIDIELGLGNRAAAADYLNTLSNRFPDSTALMQARQKLPD